MDNLHGRGFEAEKIEIFESNSEPQIFNNVKGKVKIIGGKCVLYWNDGGIPMHYDLGKGVSEFLDQVDNENISLNGVTGFRLLEPESKEEKCKNCEGRGWFDGPLTSSPRQTCRVCYGSGTIKKEEEMKDKSDFEKALEQRINDSYDDFLREKGLLGFQSKAKDKIVIVGGDSWQVVRRETATQLLAGMLDNWRPDKPDLRETWVSEAIELTDLLLKKLEG